MFARELKLDVLGVVVELMFNPCKLGIAKGLGFDSVNPPNLGILKDPGSALSPANPPKLGIVNVTLVESQQCHSSLTEFVSKKPKEVSKEVLHPI